jgi:hypothetical protein
MMADAPTLWAWRVRQLHDAFDATFALPAATSAATVAADILLLVRVGGTRAAIRVGECGGVTAASTIVTVPAAVQGFSGFTAVQGGVRPVYDLAVRLGMTAVTLARPPLVFAAAHPLAFAVDAIEGLTVADAAEPGMDTTAFVRIGGAVERLVALERIIDAVGRDTRAAASRRSGSR